MGEPLAAPAEFILSLANSHEVGDSVPDDLNDLELSAEDRLVYNIPGELWERAGWNTSVGWSRV